MKLFKRIAITVCAALFVFALVPASSFAIEPEVIQVGEEAGALIYSLYGAYNNTSLAFDSIRAGPALTEIINLYQESQVAVGGDPVSMTALGTALLTAGAVAVVWDATNEVYNLVVDLDYQNFGEFWYDFNNGWDYILSDVGGLVRDGVTNLYSYYSVNDDPIPVNVFHSSSVNGYELGLLPVRFYTASNDYYDISNTTGDVYYYLVQTPSNRVFVKIGTGQYRTTFKNGNGFNQNMPTSPANAYGDVYWQTEGAINLSYGTNSSLLPVYSSSNNDVDPTTIFGSPNTVAIENSSIDIQPSSYIGDPLTNPLEITLPDGNSPMPENQPIRIGTNIVVDPYELPDSIPSNPEPNVAYPITDPNALNSIIPDAWSSFVSDGVEVDSNPEFVDPSPDTPSNPSEVYIPLLPVTLPSFNFSFSGIWHYVVTWVGSLGSWLTLMFSVWNSLPYAIVIPVYASAVVVIIIGTLKRFL